MEIVHRLYTETEVETSNNTYKDKPKGSGVVLS